MNAVSSHHQRTFLWPWWCSKPTTYQLAENKCSWIAQPSVRHQYGPSKPRGTSQKREQKEYKSRKTEKHKAETCLLGRTKALQSLTHYICGFLQYPHKMGPINISYIRIRCVYGGAEQTTNRTMKEKPPTVAFKTPPHLGAEATLPTLFPSCH